MCPDLVRVFLDCQHKEDQGVVECSEAEVRGEKCPCANFTKPIRVLGDRECGVYTIKKEKEDKKKIDKKNKDRERKDKGKKRA
jgi:ferredoxin-thioredoxin reductase catalytic subunit